MAPPWRVVLTCTITSPSSPLPKPIIRCLSPAVFVWCLLPPPHPPRHHGGHWARLAWSTAPSLATVTLGTQLLSSPTGQTDVLFLRLDCKLLSPYFDSFSEAPGTHLVLGECLFIGEHAVSCRSADAGWRGRINQLPPAARTSAFTNLGACEVGKLDLDSSSAAASD